MRRFALEMLLSTEITIISVMFRTIIFWEEKKKREKEKLLKSGCIDSQGIFYLIWQKYALNLQAAFTNKSYSFDLPSPG